MREMISMIVVLTVLTAVSGGLLAAVKSGSVVPGLFVLQGLVGDFIV